ncbi:MAG: DUF3108 domain-containing protein [Nitrospinota bacterium]
MPLIINPISKTISMKNGKLFYSSLPIAQTSSSFMPVFLRVIVLFFLFFNFYLPSHAKCDQGLQKTDILPFHEGEELIYEISWFGIPAGTGKLHVKEKSMMDGREVFHITYSALSSEKLSYFYKVEDTAETFMDVIGLYPWRYKLKIRESRSKRDIETIFDQIGHKATFIKDQDKPVVVSIPSKVQDAFSALYCLRTNNLKVNDKVIIDVFEDKKNWQVEVLVLRKERIKIYSGEVDTILVKPLLKFEGVFQRKGDVYIWLTDDEKKIPVQVKMRILLGSIYAKIIDMRGAGVAANN